MSTKMKSAGDDSIVFRTPGELKSYERNSRIHDEKQITALMASITTMFTKKKLMKSESSLYPMDGVPFKDLETAILMANLDYSITTNDNKGRCQ